MPLPGPRDLVGGRPGALEDALRLARVGWWEWDVPANRVVWTEALYEIFGVEAGAFKADYEGYLSCVHPEDRGRVDAVVKASFASGQGYEVRHRIQRPDGDVRWILSRGEAEQRDGATVLMRGTATDVTEAVEADRLREVNEFKARFINVAAHELRTPITPMRLQLALLRRVHPENLRTDQRKALDVLDRNVERLNRLVEDVLQAARVQASSLRTQRLPLDLARVLASVRDSFEAGARQAGVELVAEIASPLPVEGDDARLEQVFTNLVTNAIKFTPEGGRVTMRAWRDGDDVVCEVRDTGRGMDEDQLARLFEPFTQVHGDPSERLRGTGLGLYICRGIVTDHGGTVTAASSGPGKGAVFTVSLPATSKAVPPHHPAPEPTTARRFRELV